MAAKVMIAAEVARGKYPDGYKHYGQGSRIKFLATRLTRIDANNAN
jgi:hypothetical protein